MSLICCFSVCGASGVGMMESGICKIRVSIIFCGGVRRAYDEFHYVNCKRGVT